VPITGAFLEGPTFAHLLQGHAILEITRGDDDQSWYWAEAVCDGGRLVGVRLTRRTARGPRTTHDVHLDGAPSCDCGDAVYRPDRPGGCKHVNALADLVARAEGRAA
jgi:hypothetical protein